MKFRFRLFALCFAWVLFPAHGNTAPAKEDKSVLRWAAATDSNAPYAFFNDQNKIKGVPHASACA